MHLSLATASELSPHVCRDLVVLIAGPLSIDSEDTLVNEGWNVRHVDAIRNPGMWHTSGAGTTQQTFPPRFWAVYTKLAIFNMTEYQKSEHFAAGASAARLSCARKPCCVQRGRVCLMCFMSMQEGWSETSVRCAFRPA